MIISIIVSSSSISKVKFLLQALKSKLFSEKDTREKRKYSGNDIKSIQTYFFKLI